MQSELVECLLDPKSYPHKTGPIAHTETHISHIFLTGSYAYKVKKPVNFGFVDFTTLERRRASCQREFTLGAQVAPNLYLGVVSIVKHGDRVDILPGVDPHGEGVVVEYAVKMRQFDQDHLLREQLRHGLVTAAHIDVLARSISRFHDRAERRPEMGGADQLWTNCSGNFSVCRTHGASFLDSTRINRLEEMSGEALQRSRSLIEARRSDKVCAGHGDLHLGNICLLDGVPTLFDPLEFNDSLSCFDRWGDLSFLIMDLIVQGRPDFATIVINSYIEESGDLDGVALVPLFCSYRAAVRAKIHALEVLHCAHDEAGVREADCHRTTARRYLEYAIAFLKRQQVFALAVGGMSGSGKSTLARELARQTGAVVIRSDVVRKRLLGLTPAERADPSAYRSEVTQQTYAEMFRQARVVLGAGRPVIFDAVFAREPIRTRVQRFSEEHGIPFCGVWCAASDVIAEARLQKRMGDASDAGVEVRRQQAGFVTAPTTWIQIDTGSALDGAVREAFAGLTGRNIVQKLADCEDHVEVLSRHYRGSL